MMLALGCSNDMPTSCNIAQHGVQTNVTCTQHVVPNMLAQHVTFICMGLKLLVILSTNYCPIVQAILDASSTKSRGLVSIHLEEVQSRQVVHK